MNAKKVKILNDIKQKAYMSLRADCKSARQSKIAGVEIASSALRLPRNDIRAYIQILMIFILSLFVSSSVYAETARDLVEQGNSLYSQGNFNKAIEKYDEALTDEPQVLEPKFNKANSYFKLEDFSNAIDLYRQVASESKDMKLVAKAKYNLGNCFFSQGMKQKDSDLQKSLDDLQNSIVNWRQTLDIEPDNQNAAKNIEVARLTIKDIIDQINKQKKEQEKQAQQQKQMQDKVKELLEKQKSLSQQSQQTQDQLDKQQIDQQQASDDYQKQSQDQSQLQNQTEQTKQEMQQQQDPNNPQSSQMQEAAKELEQASDSQKEAQQKLKNSDGTGAKESQGKAAEHLEKALEKLSQGDKQQQQQQQQSGGNPNQDQQDKEDQNKDKNQDQQNQPDQDQNQQAQEAAAPNSTAQEILDKEQRDKEQRQMLQRPSNQKVDKDW